MLDSKFYFLAKNYHINNYYDRFILSKSKLLKQLANIYDKTSDCNLMITDPCCFLRSHILGLPRISELQKNVKLQFFMC